MRPARRTSLLLPLLSLPLLAVGCSDRTPTAPEPGVTLASAPSRAGPSLASPGEWRTDVSDRFLVALSRRALAELSAAVEEMGGRVEFSHASGFALVSGLDERAAGRLKRIKGVSEVLQDALFELEPDLGDAAVEAAGLGAATPHSPGDPTAAYFYPRQWNLPAIAADQAWAAGRLGSPAVTVAILDSGIDYGHPDLAGLVDLGRSASFVPFDDLLVGILFPGRHPVTDLFFHGTHVAATVASNAWAAAGVTSGVTLMGVKVCDVNGSCPFGSLVAGMLYATDEGADVINLSLGGGFAKAANGRFLGFVHHLFNYVSSFGVTIVVSAGNEGIDLDHDGNFYKTYCSTPAVICVSGTGPVASGGTNGPWYEVDAPADYTNFGRSAISVAAPGGTEAGWVWAACSQTSLVIPICQTGTYVLGAAGTSMAAPHVSGLAALVVEDVGRRPGRVKAAIQQGADDLGLRGTDPFYGKGRINVFGTVRH